MELETLACNNCGAPVEVLPTTNYLTCAHCGSRLAVRRTETAHYTEVLEKLQARVDHVDREVKDLRIDNDLLRLDQDWEDRRKEYMMHRKDGELVEPSVGRAISSGLLAAIPFIPILCPLLVGTLTTRSLSFTTMPWLALMTIVSVSIIS